MTQTTAEKARPLPARIDQERSQRRRRDDLGTSRHVNLSIAGDLDPNYVYRFINDTPGRVHQLTVNDDWDVVSMESHHAKDKGVGSTIERIVDKRSGNRAILVRKPKHYYDADKAQAQAEIDETEKGMSRGEVKGAEALPKAVSYVPSGGIRITDTRG